MNNDKKYPGADDVSSVSVASGVNSRSGSPKIIKMDENKSNIGINVEVGIDDDNKVETRNDIVSDTESEDTFSHNDTDDNIKNRNIKNRYNINRYNHFLSEVDPY